MTNFKIILFFFILLNPLFFRGLSAQVFRFDKKEVNEEDIYFDADYIRANKIKSLKITYQYKPANDRIYDKGLIREFYFNPEGICNRQNIFEKKPGSPTDTTICTYAYTADRKLRVKRLLKHSVYQTLYFEYDSLGGLKKESFCRETNISQDPDFFKLGKQEVLSSQLYQNQHFSSNQFKRFHLNDIGKPYKQEMITLNGNKRIISQYTAFVVTSVGISEEYLYNEKDQLLEKTYFSNAGENYQEKSVYSYQDGKMTEEKSYVNGQLKYEQFYFYSTNGLPESVIKKYPSSGSIDIWKIEFSTY